VQSWKNITKSQVGGLCFLQLLPFSKTTDMKVFYNIKK